ncbi:conserved hypothetical protein [Verrucomicrobia bacterium]|nr:conserved hypothetical protein [Verrucomicrobiota bacterium]
MKEHENSGVSPAGPNAPKASGQPPRGKRHHGWRWLGVVCALIVVALSAARAFLPSLVRDYVNRTLDRNLLYAGRIGGVTIHLLRGAYSIHDVRLSQRTGNVPVPLFAAKRVDFSIQWDALLHGHVVGRFVMHQPELNLVASSNLNEAQTGAGGPWLETIRDLFPLTINSAVIEDGSVHFRTYESQKPVDVYLSHVNGSVDDLSNIRDETNPLVATVQAAALVMDQAKLEFKMTLDPFSYRPTFHLAVRLLGLDVTKLNDLALTYGKFDFKRGWFDMVLEADAQEGQLTGYVKPLFRHLKVFSLTQDLKEDSVLQFFWQALVGGATTAFKNFPRDQFGTLVPFTGNTSGTTTTDILATIGNVLRNAFVRAYLPRLEIGQSIVQDFTFEAPDFTQALSTTDSEAQ